ncbi:uncharacterized protein LOC109856532 [Pseudomyrmex gracilis]|uniref:uncharacterized protein LOC109856532 n=1 Tax=Pseudomyrmex gracilis TaxID=219809 RepID=UPI000994A1BA|nr:uncharacterized protein LOC109856532 [Pseudomyrmex gracilis]
MPGISLRTLCFVTAVLCNVQQSLEHEIPRRSFLSRRAIDGTRGRKYFDPNEDGAFDSYGSAGGQYDPYEHVTDLSDIRKNVPGEPGVDYPAYTTLPQTGFTCEGRSRGYYADEAAGCQVFHVCHDVLVSSFLCPIGSTFSQKLLTCDWWTKVDCSATNRYLEVNRNNYQIDDDEMIRNAYAMISLQSSAEDVTKDGLVDPDSGARIIDYSVLGGGRTVTSYTPVSFRRITDYPAVDTTGNDLPSGFEDYPNQDNRQILNYNRFQQKSTNPTYQNKFHLEGKGRSPYHAAAIIRQNYQDQSRSNEQFRDDYRGPDGFTNQLQTSYAPTVPTVTTTTRRFYSPTVPTTYRPSTLAYSKLDLIMDSSDHLYAHSKNPATPPTTSHHRDDDEKNADLRESETRHDGPRTSENVGDNQSDDVARSKNDEVRLLNFEEKKSETSFRINLTAIEDEEDEVFRQQNDRPVIRNDYEENLEDIETGDSIGIARALNDPDRIGVQNQNPVEETFKDERKKRPSSSSQAHTIRSSGSSSVDNSSQTLTNIFNETSDDQSTEDYEDVTSSTTRIYEETGFTTRFGVRTTPLLRNWHQKDVDTVQASTFSVTAKPTTIESNVDEVDRSSSNGNQTSEDQNSSLNKPISSLNDESAPRIHLNFEVPQPSQFLRPPAKSFLINIPEEETRYATTDQNSKTTWGENFEITTELPQFSVTSVENIQDRSPVYNANVQEQSLFDYANDKLLSETTNLDVNPITQATPKVSTPIPWLVSSSWQDRSIVDSPATDIVPPFANQNDGFDDLLVPPNEESARVDQTERADAQIIQRNSSTTSRKTINTEEPILIRYEMGFHLSIRDAIKAQEEARRTALRAMCESSAFDKQNRSCETSSVAPKTNSAVGSSTASVEEKTVSIGTKATTRFPEQLTFSASSRLPEKSVTIIRNEFSTFTTPLPVTVDSNVGTERSTLKTIASGNVLQSNRQNLEEKAKETESTSLRSTRTESLKQTKETIDKHGSPYEVSFTVNQKDEDPDPTIGGDDFIGRLIAQQSALPLKQQLNDFEIVKSIETKDEIVIPQVRPTFPDHTTGHAFPDGENNSDPINDTIYELPRESNSNVSMLSLVQLMAELLKLDRLPRPFSAKDFHSADLRDSFDLDLDEPSLVTANPPLDRSQTRAPFGNANFKPSNFDISKTPRVAKSRTRLNQDNPSFDASSSPISFLDDTSNTEIPLRSFSDDSSKINSNAATEQKTIQSKSENRTIRPLQKEEILEQLTENFGRPLYRDDSIHRSFVFDLPQVQRNLDFESGLPISEDKRVSGEPSEESSIFSTERTPTTTTQQTITTTESARTVVETEFVPSLGFSFDTNEGREEYVQAFLKGLIDEHNGEGDEKNESRKDVDVALSPDEPSKTDTSKLEGTKNV